MPENCTNAVVISPALRSWRHLVGSLWARREIVGYLAWRDIRAKYHRAVLGALWVLMQPIASTIVFTFVFGHIAGISAGSVPFPIFVLSGVLPWQFIAASIQRSSMSLLANGPMLKKVYFPRMAIPMAAVLTGLVEFCGACFVLLAVMLYYGFVPGWHILLLPVVMLLSGSVILGVGLLLASINCHFRDVSHCIGFILQMWMFLTPVVYPPTMVPAKLQPLLQFNPMSGLIAGYRAAFLGMPVDVHGLAMSLLVGLIRLVIGAAVFRIAERSVADIL